MKICGAKIEKIEDVIYCLFIIVFLSMNNIRVLFVLFEFLFVLLGVFHFFRRPYPLTFLLFWGASWLFACFLSIMFADIRQISGCLSVAQMTIVTNFIYPLMHDDEKYSRWFLNCYWFSALFLLFRQFAVSGFDTHSWARMGSDFGYNANYVGIIGAYAGIFSGLNFFYYRKRYGLLQLALALVIVILSGSRTSLAILVIGVAFEFLCEIMMNQNWLKKLGLCVFCVILACFVLWLCFTVPLFYDMLGQRIETFILSLQGAQTSERSTNIRISMISEGLEVFSRHPITGIGIGNSGAYSVYSTYFHNNYVEILADTGLIGFTVYYSFWFVMAIYAIRSFRRLGKTNTLRRMLFCSIGLIMASLVGDIGHVSYYSENSLMVFPVLFYMLQCCMGRIKLKSIEKERANEPESILAET